MASQGKRISETRELLKGTDSVPEVQGSGAPSPLRFASGSDDDGAAYGSTGRSGTDLIANGLKQWIWVIRMKSFKPTRHHAGLSNSPAASPAASPAPSPPGSPKLSSSPRTIFSSSTLSAPSFPTSDKTGEDGHERASEKVDEKTSINRTEEKKAETMSPEEKEFRELYAHLRHVFGKENLSAIPCGSADVQHSYIKIRCDLARLEARAQQEGIQLDTTGDNDAAYFPFDTMLKFKGFFAHPHEAPCPAPRVRECKCDLFTPYEKQELTQNMIWDACDNYLTQVNNGAKSYPGHGFQHLKKQKVITDMFPMHLVDDTMYYEVPNNIAHKHCSGKGIVFSAVSGTKPAAAFTSYLRDYFGEKVALFFEFIQFMNVWLAVLAVIGVATFILSQSKNADNALIPVYSFLLTLWATLFVKFWVRRQSWLSYKWHMREYSAKEQVLSRFLEHVSGHELGQAPAFGFYEDGGRWVDLEDWVKEEMAKKGNEEMLPFVPRYYRDVSGKCPHICFDWLGDDTPKGKWRRAEQNALWWRFYKEISSQSVIFTLIGVVLVVTISLLVVRLILQGASTTYGGLIAGVLNAISISILDQIYRYIAIQMTIWENHRTATLFEDKLTTKLFLFQFINSYFSLFYIAFFKAGTLSKNWTLFTYTDVCKDYNGNQTDNCMYELQSQLISILVTRLIIGNFTQVAIPYITGWLKVWWEVRKAKKRILVQHPTWNDEQVEMEMRDQNKGAIVSEMERQSAMPEYVVTENVSGVFNDYNQVAIGFGYLVLFSAAFPLAPLVLFVSNLVDCSTTGWMLLATTRKPEYYGAKDIGRYLLIFKFLLVASVVTNVGLITFTSSQFGDLFVNEATTLQKFTIAIVLEHGVLLILYLVWNSFNDYPNELRQALAYDAQIKEIMTEYDEWLQQRRDAIDSAKNGDEAAALTTHQHFDAQNVDVQFDKYDEKAADKAQAKNEQSREEKAQDTLTVPDANNV